MGVESKKSAPIGVFDSGVGGLTVVREIVRQLPNENIVYFGDTARVPYGSKSRQTIIRFSEQIIRFLKTKEVKAIVIACNTASALALDAVRDEYDIPILGVVVPGARAAVEATVNKKSRRRGNRCDRAERRLYKDDPGDGSGGGSNRESLSAVCSACGRGVQRACGDAGDHRVLSGIHAGDGYRRDDLRLYALSAFTLQNPGISRRPDPDRESGV